MWDKLSQVVDDSFSHLHIIWRSVTTNCKNAKKETCVHKWKLKQRSILTNSQLLRQSLHYFGFTKFGSSNLNLFSSPKVVQIKTKTCNMYVCDINTVWILPGLLGV